MNFYNEERFDQVCHEVVQKLSSGNGVNGTEISVIKEIQLSLNDRQKPIKKTVLSLKLIASIFSVSFIPLSNVSNSILQE